MGLSSDEGVVMSRPKQAFERMKGLLRQDQRAGMAPGTRKGGGEKWRYRLTGTPRVLFTSPMTKMLWRLPTHSMLPKVLSMKS